jgi:hypothetical protein
MEKKSNTAGGTEIGWGVIGFIALAALIVLFYFLNSGGAH